MAGVCYPECAPACPRGFVCTVPYGGCAPTQLVPPWILGLRRHGEREQRLQYRMRPRLGLVTEGAVMINMAPEIPMFGVRAGVAYRHQVTPWLGLQYRGTVRAGLAAVDGDGSPMVGFGGDVLLAVGGRGRVYGGPMLWAEYLRFAKSSLERDTGEILALEDGFVKGLGGEIGVALGRREQTSVHSSFRFGLSEAGPLCINFGVTFHRLLDD